MNQSFHTSDYKPLLAQFLSTNGDGTGTVNANVNGAVTPVVFKISPPATGSIVITRLIVTIRDNGTFSAEKYGVISELANGVEVGRLNDTTDAVEQDLTSGIPITTNASWGRLCYDVDLKTWGAGDSFLLVRWTFAKHGSCPLLISGGPALGISINDDLTTLVEHHFLVQGFTDPG